MVFKKTGTLEYLEKFFEDLEKQFYKLDVELDIDYDIFSQDFKTGYFGNFTKCDSLHDSDPTLIWVWQDLDSECINILLGDSRIKKENNTFDSSMMSFVKKYENIENALKGTLGILKEVYKKHFNINNNFEYIQHYNLYKIERISLDADSLEYEDYYDLASINMKEAGYCCDLIVLDGKFGLRYSKYIGDEIDNLSFEEMKFYFTNENTLMLKMKEKLTEFITNELIYEKDNNYDVKI